MKLSKLTKKLLCTSLVAVGIITTMGGFNANAASVHIGGTINLRYTGSVTSSIDQTINDYWTEGQYTVTETAGVYTQGWKKNAYSSKLGRSIVLYHAATSIRNGVSSDIGYWYYKVN